MDWLYTFTVEGLTPAQAEALLDLIVTYAESHNATVGGGYTPQDVTDEQEENA